MRNYLIIILTLKLPFTYGQEKMQGLDKIAFDYAIDLFRQTKLSNGLKIHSNVR